MMWTTSGRRRLSQRFGFVLPCSHSQRKAPFVPSLSIDVRRRWNSSSVAKKPSWFSRVVTWYDRQLERRPFLTKGLTGGFVAANGDLLCQFLMHRYDSSNNDIDTDIQNDSSLSKFWNVWNTRRTFHFFCLGSMWIAPVLHLWYGFLSRQKSIFTAASSSSRAAMLLLGQRVALDQFVFTPLFAPTFLAGLWGLDGSLSLEKLQRQLPAIMPSMLCANWMIWIPAQAINFSFVPVPYQVLFSNVVSLFWNAIVSFLEQQKKHPESAASTSTTVTTSSNPETQAR